MTDDEFTLVFKREPSCQLCGGTGWVCENCGTQWEAADGETCCGAGKNCECNPSGHYEFKAVYASTEPEKVERWVQ